MGRVRVVVNRHAIEAILRSDKALEVVKEKVDAIAEACNADSTWGGYFSSAAINADRARGIAWSADARNDEGRDQRLVKNMDA